MSKFEIWSSKPQIHFVKSAPVEEVPSKVKMSRLRMFYPETCHSFDIAQIQDYRYHALGKLQQLLFIL